MITAKSASIQTWARRVVDSEMSKTGNLGGVSKDGAISHNDVGSGILKNFTTFAQDLVSSQSSSRVFVMDDVTGEVVKSTGDARLSKIHGYLARLDDETMFPRSLKQKELHKIFTCAMMHLIYGEEFDIRYSELKLRLNVVEFYRLIACSMPRRFGKTQSVAMHNAVMLLSMTRNFTINVFSPNWRASKLLLKLCYSIIIKLNPDAAELVEVCNVDQLSLRDAVTKTLKVLNSYPGGVRNPIHTHARMHAHARELCFVLLFVCMCVCVCVCVCVCFYQGR